MIKKPKNKDLLNRPDISEEKAEKNTADSVSEKNNDASEKPKVVRAKDSVLPVPKEQEKSKLATLKFLLLIVGLIALFVIGIKYFGEEETKEDSNLKVKQTKVETIELEKVKISLPSNVKYEVLGNDELIISGVHYSPVYDNNGVIISYIDENGNEYSIGTDNVINFGDIQTQTLTLDGNIKVAIPLDVKYSVLDNGEINIGGVKYSPVYDELGNVISYTDEKGFEYTPTEVSGSTIVITSVNSTQKISINDIKVVIPGSVKYEVLADDIIKINGIEYTPVYNETGIIISYVDTEGHQFNVQDNVIKIDIKVDIPDKIESSTVDSNISISNPDKINGSTVNSDININDPGSVENQSVNSDYKIDTPDINSNTHIEGVGKIETPSVTPPSTVDLEKVDIP